MTKILIAFTNQNAASKLSAILTKAGYTADFQPPSPSNLCFDVGKYNLIIHDSREPFDKRHRPLGKGYLYPGEVIFHMPEELRGTTHFLSLPHNLFLERDTSSGGVISSARPRGTDSVIRNMYNGGLPLGVVEAAVLEQVEHVLAQPPFQAEAA